MGILSEMQPKPDLAVLSVAGQPCYNGGGYTGTATELILDSLKRLDYPKQARLFSVVCQNVLLTALLCR